MIYLMILSVSILSLLTPWWTAILVTFLMGYHSEKCLRTLGAGFAGMFLVWVIFAYYFDARGHGLISLYLAKMLGLSNGALVILLTGIVGGSFGACGVWCGFNYRRMVKNE